MPRREVCIGKSGMTKGKSNALPREISLPVSVETNTAVMLCDALAAAAATGTSVCDPRLYGGGWRP